MALAKKRKAHPAGCEARSALPQRRLPTCRTNRLTLHVLAAPPSTSNMIGERTRLALSAAKARGIKLGNPKQAEINRARPQAQALAPARHDCERGRSRRAAQRRLDRVVTGELHSLCEECHNTGGLATA
jgi:hypothetical protein